MAGRAGSDRVFRLEEIAAVPLRHTSDTLRTEDSRRVLGKDSVGERALGETPGFQGGMHLGWISL